MLEASTLSSSTQSHSPCFLFGHRNAGFLSRTLVNCILVLLILMQSALVSPSSAQDCQYSPYWGQDGELWNPSGPLKDYSHVGYHEGNDPIPYQQRSASKSFGPGRFTITDRIIITNGVLRGAGKDKTVLYFPNGLVGMGYPCPGKNCWEWNIGVIQLGPGSEIGLEDLTIEFAPHKWTHHNGQGYNGPTIEDCVNCWIKNVKVINADEGFGFHRGHHNTLDNVEIIGGYHNYIHMTLTQNNLVTNFRASGGSYHGFSGNWDTHGGVYANGWGNPVVINPDHNGPPTTGLLYSNIQGTGGKKSSMSDTFLWNYMNQTLCPLDIHQAQLARRLGMGMAPVADAGLDQTVLMGEAVTFDGRGSRDSDGEALTFHWDFGDGSTSTQAVATHSYATAGLYTATLTVEDGSLSDSDSAVVRVTSLPSDGETWRVNAGGGSYTDGGGNEWSKDQPYSPGGWGYIGGKTYSSRDAIANTSDDPLYQTTRYGNFGYRFDVPSGEYDVTVHFGEDYWNAPGKRLFDVYIEGMLVLDNYDIYATAGHDVAVVLTFPGVVVDDGQLILDFVTVKDNALISAIEIR
jgi:PKD repeat protein